MGNSIRIWSLFPFSHFSWSLWHSPHIHSLFSFLNLLSRYTGFECAMSKLQMDAVVEATKWVAMQKRLEQFAEHLHTAEMNVVCVCEENCKSNFSYDDNVGTFFCPKAMEVPSPEVDNTELLQAIDRFLSNATKRGRQRITREDLNTGTKKRRVDEQEASNSDVPDTPKRSGATKPGKSLGVPKSPAKNAETHRDEEEEAMEEEAPPTPKKKSVMDAYRPTSRQKKISEFKVPPGAEKEQEKTKTIPQEEDGPFTPQMSITDQENEDRNARRLARRKRAQEQKAAEEATHSESRGAGDSGVSMEEEFDMSHIPTGRRQTAASLMTKEHVSQTRSIERSLDSINEQIKSLENDGDVYADMLEATKPRLRDSIEQILGGAQTEAIELAWKMPQKHCFFRETEACKQNHKGNCEQQMPQFEAFAAAMRVIHQTIKSWTTASIADVTTAIQIIRDKVLPAYKRITTPGDDQLPIAVLNAQLFDSADGLFVFSVKSIEETIRSLLAQLEKQLKEIERI